MHCCPFDTQIWTLTISLTEYHNEVITVQNNGHEDLGPVEITQHRY